MQSHEKSNHENKKRRVTQVITGSFPCTKWLHKLYSHISPFCELCRSIRVGPPTSSSSFFWVGVIKGGNCHRGQVYHFCWVYHFTWCFLFSLALSFAFDCLCAYRYTKPPGIVHFSYLVLRPFVWTFEQICRYSSLSWCRNFYIERDYFFLRQAREFLFFPLLPREASKRVPIFDRGTGSKPERLRSGSLQPDLSLIA